MFPSRSRLLGAIWLLLLSFSFHSSAVIAGDPTVSITRFHNLPSKLFYFDDTTTVLMHDPYFSNVQISSDEGLSWALVDGVPDGAAVRLIQHPFSNTIAFVLGRDKTHWVTNNRGQSWQSFEVEQEASLFGEVLSFHAGHPGEFAPSLKILEGINQKTQTQPLSFLRLRLGPLSSRRLRSDRGLGDQNMFRANILHAGRIPDCPPTSSQADKHVYLGSSGQSIRRKLLV